MRWSQLVSIIVVSAFEAVNLSIFVDGDGEIRIRTNSFQGALGRYGKCHLRQSDVWHGFVVAVDSRRLPPMASFAVNAKLRLSLSLSTT